MQFTKLIMQKNIHKIFIGLSFFIPFMVYFLTMAPTTSFWDCGEYIATSKILGVPHPPGSPLYLLIGNFFSNLPFLEDIGARVNLLSPIASALSVMFLYLIIVYLIEEYRGKTKTISDALITYCPAFIASLTFAVTDSHWFNAVEAEVYSVSTFFTAIVAWLIMLWSRNLENWNIRYLLIIIYMFGLAIGVHLLNLLTLPFVALIIYFKKFKFKPITFLITVLITLLTFFIIYVGVVKGIPDITNKTGSLFFALFLPLILITTIFINNFEKVNKIYVQIFSVISILSISVLLLNSYFINTPEQIINNKYDYLINMGQKLDTIKKEIDKLQNSQSLNYEIIENKINRYNEVGKVYKNELENWEQLQKMDDLASLDYLSLISLQKPLNIFLILLILIALALFYYYFSKKDFLQTQSLVNFFFSAIILIFIGYSTYVMIFIRANQNPNINENSPDTINRALAYMNRDQYGDWSIIDRKSTIVRPENTNWKRYTYDKNNPTINDQISFFIKYQVNEMYLRYFSWQFIGRGERDFFPWHIKDLDGNIINNQKPLDGINWFRYGLPFAFILGLFGLIFHFSRDWKRALAVLSFFLATGLMIIIYLNQYDPQPRERDYSFVASFFAFSIWIGIGLSGVLSKIRSFFEDYNIASFISISCLSFAFLFMPVKIFSKDYFQHDRSNNFVAWDYGYNLLNSCEPDGIIFTNGDNDTFPLWYLQEVEGIRKDVKVINLSLLNTPWYINQLINNYPKLNLKIDKKYLKEKINNKGELIDTETPDIYNLTYVTGTKMALELCGLSSAEIKDVECRLSYNNKNISFKYRPSQGIGQWLPLQDTMILQIINDIGEDQPIYFATTVSSKNLIGLEKYLQMEGMVYRLLSNKKNNDLNYTKMKQNLSASEHINIIRNKNDYHKAIKNGDGIYRYTNLNDSSIFYNNNIKRLVQNYRYGFITLAQSNIKLNKAYDQIEIEELLSQMNQYFPEYNFPLDPSQNLLIAETIYEPIGDNESYKKIIHDLVHKELFNNNISIELKIEILRILAKVDGNSDLFLRSIKDFFQQYNLTIEHEMYLATFLYQVLSLEDFEYLCNTVFNSFLKLESEIVLLQGIIETNDYKLISNNVERIFMKFYKNDQFNFELQKYIGDIISKNLTISQFKNTCEVIFEEYQSVGLLYALTFALEENKISTNKILEITNDWISIQPQNEQLIRLKNYLIETNQFQ
mgnify:FL=1